MQKLLTGKFKRLTAAVLALLLVATLLPVSARAEEQRTVRVGYVDSAPFGEIREDGYKSGSTYEYLQEIAYITGWKYDYVYGTFEECYEMLKKGEIDLFSNVSYTPERAEEVCFSDYPQGSDTSWIYTNSKHKELTGDNLTLLNGQSIAVNKGSIQMAMLEDWLRETGINAKVVPVERYDVLEQVLDSGMVWAIVVPDDAAFYNCVPVVNIGDSEYFFAVSKNQPDVLKELNEALAEIHRTKFDFNGMLARAHYVRPEETLRLTQKEKKWLKQRNNTITLGLLENNLPYATRGEDGKIQGILSALQNTMTQKMGVNVEARFYPRAELITAALNSGEVDAAAPRYCDYYIGEMKNYVLTEDFASTTLTAIYAKDGFDEEKGIIAVSDDTLMSEIVVKTLFPKATTLRCKDQEGCLNAVLEGKADYTLTASIKLNMLRSYPSMQQLQFFDLPITAGVCFATTKTNRLAASILNKGIAMSLPDMKGSLLAQSSYVERETTWREFLKNNIETVVAMVAFIILLLASMAALLYQKNREVEASLEQAKEANLAKTDFLSRMSHDIRTPMNAIINLTELAKKENDGEAVRGYLDKVSVSCSFLLGLINDVLDMSKIESGELTLHIEPFTRDELYESMNTVIRPLMDAKNINFHCEINAGHKQVMADKLRFTQILFNLLSNAAKFTPEGGDVWFAMNNTQLIDGKQEITVTVRDNGIGMSEEYQKHIFEPFSQEHSKLTDNTNGTGLGLPIVKSLVEAMGGSISLKSEVGVGTEFTVKFFVGMIDEDKRPESETDEKPALDGLRVLVVEDNDINTLVAKLLLEEVGCVAYCVENGKEAVDAFAGSPENGFDAILMDVRMPVMDGLEATARIRAMDRPDAATVPIIAMTADAFAEEKKRTIRAGMNYHLSKPVEPKLLYAALMRYAVKGKK